MFTGIIEEIGTIRKIQREDKGARLFIGAKKILEDVKIGDSIAVNGVCLTVTSFRNTEFTADVMNETLERSTFTNLKSGSRVNLERAMAADGRFGGHIVAGHIDGIGKIVHIIKDGIAIWYVIQASQGMLRYVVEKGSVAVDGISLTVAGVGEDTFSVSTIPHTIQETVLQDRKVGDEVNLENDIVGKYIERFLTKENPISSGEGITQDFLSRCGY